MYAVAVFPILGKPRRSAWGGKAIIEAQDAEIAAKSGVSRSRIKSIRRAGPQETRAEVYKAQCGVR